MENQNMVMVSGSDFNYLEKILFTANLNGKEFPD